MIDDILIWGKDQDEHDKRLKQVLDICSSRNLKLNPKKTKIRVSEVKYLGHVFTADGLEIDQEKVQAVNEMQ